jgi:hypothetical protein
MIAPALTDPIEDARAICILVDRSKVGWIVANIGPGSWDVWLDVYAAGRRLRRGVIQVERRVVALSSLIWDSCGT